MNKLVVAFIAIILAIAFFLFIRFSIQPTQTTNLGESAENNIFDASEPPIIFEPTENEEAKALQNEFESESSSTSSDENPQSNTNTDCSISPIPYSLKGLTTDSNCITENNGICEQKEITCEITIQNLDDSSGGLFTLRFEFNDEEDNLLSEDTASVEINAGQKQTLEITNTFTQPDSQKDIVCSVTTTQTPTKDVC